MFNMLLLTMGAFMVVGAYLKYRSIVRDVKISGPSIREGYVMAEVDESFIPYLWKSRIAAEIAKGEENGFNDYKLYQCCYKKALGFQWLVIAGVDAQGEVVHAVNLFRTINPLRYIGQHIPLIGCMFIWLESELRDQFYSLLENDILVTGFCDDGISTTNERRDEKHIDVFIKGKLTFRDSVTAFRNELNKIEGLEKLSKRMIPGHRRIFKAYEAQMNEYKANVMTSYGETYGEPGREVFRPDDA